MQAHFDNKKTIDIVIDICSEETQEACDKHKKEYPNAYTPDRLVDKQFKVPFDFGISLRRNDVLVFGENKKPKWFLGITAEEYHKHFAATTIRIYRRTISGEGIMIFAEV